MTESRRAIAAARRLVSLRYDLERAKRLKDARRKATLARRQREKRQWVFKGKKPTQKRVNLGPRPYTVSPSSGLSLPALPRAVSAYPLGFARNGNR